MKMDETETTKSFLSDIANEEETVRGTEIPTDTPWAKKLFLGLMLNLTLVILGIGHAIPGSTLLDLALINNSTVAETSSIITARAVGGVFGSALLPVINRRFSHWVPLGLAQLSTAFLLAAVPWCPNLVSMVTLFSLHGICRVFVDGACYTAMVDIWGVDNAPWVAGLACVFGVGCLISPVIVKPFITHQHHIINTDVLDNTTITFPDTQVHIPYAITGLLFLLNALMLFTIAIITYKCWYVKGHIEKKERKISPNEENDKRSLVHSIYSRLTCKISFENVLIALQGAFTFSHVLIQISCAMFIVVFLVEYIGWTKDKSIDFLFIFFTSLTISRGLGAIINKYIHTKFTIMVCIVLIATAIISLALPIQTHEIVIWVTLITLSISYAPLYAAGLTFCDAYMPLDSVVVGATQLGCTLAGIIGPFVFGALYNVAGPFVLVYILIAACSLMIVCFSCMFVIAQRHGERDKNQGNDLDGNM